MKVLIRSFNQSYDNENMAVLEKFARIIEGKNVKVDDPDSFVILPGGHKRNKLEHLTILAETIEFGAQSLGAKSPNYIRLLKLVLDKSDLQQIFEAALKAGLLTIPGAENLIAAKKHLDEATSQLGLGTNSNAS